MKKIIFVCLLSLMSDYLQAQTSYKTIQQLLVNFELKNVGIKVEGNFSQVQGEVFVDPQHITDSHFEGKLKTASVSTGNQLRDKHLTEKSEFFNSAKFPDITLKSTKVSASQYPNSYKVDWLLTIKGITKKITTDVLIAPSNGTVLLLTVFKLNRLDWKLGSNSLTMSNEVMITLNCTASE